MAAGNACTCTFMEVTFNNNEQFQGKLVLELKETSGFIYWHHHEVIICIDYLLTCVHETLKQ